MPQIAGLRTGNIIFLLLISWMERIIYLQNIWTIHWTEIGFKIKVRLYSCYGSLANSLNKQIFQSFVRKAMSKQEQDKLIINNLSIDIYPRIAEIFERSQSVSGLCSLSLIFNLVSCEKAHHLRRKVVLRDKKEQKEVEEKELKDAAKQVPELLSEIESLRQVIEEKDR